MITRRPGAGEGRTVRLDLGGAAADEGSDWRGAQGAAADGRAKGAAGAAQGGAARSGRGEGSAGKNGKGRGSFVFSRTFLLKMIILSGVVSRAQLPKSFSVFGQRQVFYMLWQIPSFF